jgi:UTP:GlnB (protein PII) uridylyltransferase
VLEIVGRDRQGLLAEIMDAFASVNCSVWSASIWTSKSARAAFVLGVSDGKQPLAVEANWQELRGQLLTLLGGEEGGAAVTKGAVVRRLLHVQTCCTCKHAAGQ